MATTASNHPQPLCIGGGFVRLVQPMRPVIRTLAMGTAAALILAACATGNVMATTAAAGTRFSGKGKLTFHRGEPCTSQIMYDFHPADSRAVVWLAAGAHESKKLAEAIQQRRGVRVTGVWQRGQHPGCAYVDVKKLTVERTWWNKLWNP